MSQRRSCRASRPSNDIGFLFDELVRAAVRHIDERPWLQTSDGDAQRSIFVGVCMSIQWYSISDVPFDTFRSRILYAYAHSGLVQRFESRTVQSQRKRPAKNAKKGREARVRARSAPAVAQRAPAQVETVSAYSLYPVYLRPGTFLTNAESRRGASPVAL